MATRVAVIAGTRPEAIKLIPVHRALQRTEGIDATFVSAGQHREMLDDVLESFAVRADVKLATMTENQSMGEVLGRLVAEIGEVFARARYDLVLVQGDTSTTLAAALAAHYARVPVGHVEAGLRTHDRWAPFPEETHRRMVSAIADYHFAATRQAADALAAENISRGVHVVGNTVVDALLMMRQRVQSEIATYDAVLGELKEGVSKYILLTAHRRENFGAGLAQICDAAAALVDRYPDMAVVFCVHLNPNVREVVHARLGEKARIHLLPPQPYDRMVHLMMGAWLILTDSGGLQEEAPSCGVPLLVMREKTERPEGIEAGCARLVGTDTERVLSEVDRLVCDEAAYQAMATVRNPYGDGLASERIAGLVRTLCEP